MNCNLSLRIPPRSRPSIIRANCLGGDDRRPWLLLPDLPRDCGPTTGTESVFEKCFAGSTGDPPFPSGDSPDGTGATARANGGRRFATLLAAFPVGAGKLVGYSSLRIGLLDALAQIGGPEAAELSLQTLQKTGDAQEIAYLAKALEKQLPPEQFRPAAVSAASEALAQSITGPGDGRSPSPLFEVSPTLTDLAPLEYHQTKRVDHRLF